jgi:phthalate 4,5-cis-dihydrodiol dehydrogenase
MGSLKFGLVGIGAQTQENILPALLQIPDVQIVAACDVAVERAALLRRHVKDVALYDDVAGMIRNEALDALVVVCPPQAHRDIAQLAIEHGLNVFVEKPPCLNLEELTVLSAASLRARVVTGVGMNFRFARPIQHLRRIRQDAMFGRIAHIQLNHYANKPRTPLWGLSSTLRSFLLAQAIHTIDLAILFGGTIKEIHSDVQNDNGCLIVEIGISFESGATAALLTGTMFPYFEFDMKIVSNRSTMVQLDNLWNITLHEPDHVTRTGGVDKRWRAYWQPGPLDSGYARSGYQGELQGFVDSVRNGREFEADFACLLPTYRVIEEICARHDTVYEGERQIVRSVTSGEPLTLSAAAI